MTRQQSGCIQNTVSLKHLEIWLNLHIQGEIFILRHQYISRNTHRLK